VGGIGLSNARVRSARAFADELLDLRDEFFGNGHHGEGGAAGDGLEFAGGGKFGWNVDQLS